MAFGYYFCKANQLLEKKSFIIENIGADEVVVKVAGCGLCHTDLGFYTGAVQTKHELPLILGHEISGQVIAAGPLFQGKIGKNVIVPAVLPCGECELCQNERDNICQHQKMPGNDFHGGFATHITVPGRFLCELPDDLKNFKLHQLSVIADAVTTPYQSLLRSRLKAGDLAIVIGTGGIGTYMVQHAKNAGATVVAIEVDEKKLKLAQIQGADHGILSAGLSEKDIKKKVRELVSENNLPQYQWKVFETSGSVSGQNLAFSLLNFAGTVGIVGFTMDKLSLRLSNLMAFDADIFGNWGCRPKHYDKVVRDVLDRKINLSDNIQDYPLDSINEIFSLAKNHKLEKRAILVP